MKASNATIRQHAIFYAVLWTVIPMLLSATGVFVHFQVKEKEAAISRAAIEKLQKQISRDSVLTEKMTAGIGTIDSLFKKLEQTEKQYQSALQSASPDETTLAFDLETQARLLNARIETLKRETAGSGQSEIYPALLAQYQLVLNFKEKIRKTWKQEATPVQCPELETKVERLETEKQELFAKYLACLAPKGNSSGNAGVTNTQIRQLQTEKIVQEKEVTDLRKEVQQWQKLHADLVTNLKEVLTAKSPSDNKKEKLSQCEDQMKLIESIVRSGGKSSNAARANYNN